MTATALPPPPPIKARRFCIPETFRSYFFQKNIAGIKKGCTFAPTVSTTLPVRLANQGGTFVLGNMKYNKQPISIADQIAQLKSRGWKLKTRRKSGLEKALDDVAAGRVYEAKSFEDLIEQLEK